MVCSCSVNRHKGMGIMIRCTCRTHEWSLEDTREVSVLHSVLLTVTDVKLRLRTVFCFRIARSTHMISPVYTRRLALHSASRLQNPHYLLRAIKGWACCGCASYHEITQADQNTRITIRLFCTKFFPVFVFFLLLPQCHTFFQPITAASASPFCRLEKKKRQKTNENKTRIRLVDEEATDERRLNMERKPLTRFFHWSKWGSAVWTQHVNSGRRDVVGKGQLHRDVRCLVKRPAVVHFWHMPACELLPGIHEETFKWLFFASDSGKFFASEGRWTVWNLNPSPFFSSPLHFCTVHLLYELYRRAAPACTASVHPA